MSVAQLISTIAEPGTRLLPLTVEQYHQMVAQGILEEGAPYELLDGLLVLKDRSKAGEDLMTVGHEHAWVIRKLTDLNAKLKRLACHMQIQLPISVPPVDEPEPDGAIVVGVEDDYRDRHPSSEDILAVIEVADSSLRRDRTTKARIYASAGIKLYIIINLPDRIIEIYSEPDPEKGRYRRSETLVPGQQLILPAAKGKKLKIPVKTLLP